jgi:hypothetical protein
MTMYFYSVKTMHAWSQLAVRVRGSAKRAYDVSHSLADFQQLILQFHPRRSSHLEYLVGTL